jgi:hypothetical protein
LNASSSAGLASIPDAHRTKTLIASAYAAHLARRASDYGVTIAGAIKVDMREY